MKLVRALRVAFADFSATPGRALKNQNAAPASPPCVPLFGFAIFPRPGEVFPKGESLWRNQKVYRSAKASPFGRGGREQRERTERARPSAKEN
mgnify:CR=1 FL=1